MRATWTTQKGAIIEATLEGEKIMATINGTQTIRGLDLVDHPQHGQCLKSGNNYIPVACDAAAAVEALHGEMVTAIKAQAAKESKLDREYKAATARIYRAMDTTEDREPADRSPWQKGDDR